jgi:hypothetical protein
MVSNSEQRKDEMTYEKRQEVSQRNLNRRKMDKINGRKKDPLNRPVDKSLKVSYSIHKGGTEMEKAIKDEWTIYVTRTEKGWMCDMSESKDSEKIKEFFGSYILPSSYTKDAKLDAVLNGLARLNPMHTIIDTDTGMSTTKWWR